MPRKPLGLPSEGRSSDPWGALSFSSGSLVTGQNANPPTTLISPGKTPDFEFLPSRLPTVTVFGGPRTLCLATLRSPLKRGELRGRKPGLSTGHDQLTAYGGAFDEAVPDRFAFDTGSMVCIEANDPTLSRPADELTRAVLAIFLGMVQPCSQRPCPTTRSGSSCAEQKEDKRAAQGAPRPLQ
jgi:hypothetical protein